MSSAGGRPSRQKMASVRTSIVPPGPCPPPADTPGTSPSVTTPQVTALIHDFAVSLQPDPIVPDLIHRGMRVHCIRRAVWLRHSNLRLVQKTSTAATTPRSRYLWLTR